VFSALISTLFIYSSVNHISIYFTEEHKTVAVVSMLLLFLTVYVSMQLEGFKSLPLLTPGIRDFLTNFNMLLAIIIVTAFANWMQGQFWSYGCFDCSDCNNAPICDGGGSNVVKHCIGHIPNVSYAQQLATGHAVHTRRLFGGSAAPAVASNITCTIGSIPLLNVPETAFATTTNRAWAVDMFSVTPGPQPVLLGLLLALLFFVEQNITSVMLAAHHNKLKKDPAFHWDMFLVGLMVLVCGQFGLPVAHASLPHSLYHCQALGKKKQELVIRNGVARYETEVTNVCETRWSALGVNVLILATISVLPACKDLVPAAVPYGLFFYMGYSALLKNPLVKRLGYIWTEPQLLNPSHMFRKVEGFWIHMYSFLQVVWLALIWLVKKKAGAYFPLVIMAMLPFRQIIMPMIFNTSSVVTSASINPDEPSTKQKTSFERWTRHTQYRDMLDHTKITKYIAGCNFNEEDLTKIKAGSITQGIEELKTCHDDDIFKGQVAQLASVLEKLAERGDMLGEQHKEDAKKYGALRKELLCFKSHVPIDRLAVLDAHDAGDDDHHEKKS